MRQLVRLLTGIVTMVSVLSLGGATGLSAPLGKDGIEQVAFAAPEAAIDEPHPADSGPIGVAVASVSQLPAAAGPPGVDDSSLSDGSDLGTQRELAEEFGIPSMVLDAYSKAADSLSATNPSCGIRWQILAGIGKVESNHAAGGRLTATGVASPPILGPVLDGNGFASISDHDGGRWDGDTVWDRAVGPMQFIPGTWKAYGSDGSGDGIPDPHNVYDAALSAAKYLCTDSTDLTKTSGLRSALLRYNYSTAYVATVMSWIAAYDDGLGSVVPIVGPPRDPGGGGSGNPGNRDDGNDNGGNNDGGDNSDEPESPSPDPSDDPDPQPTKTATHSPDPEPTLTHSPTPTREPTSDPPDDGPTPTPTISVPVPTATAPSPEPTPEPTDEEPTSEPTDEEPTPEPTDEEPTPEPTDEEPTSEEPSEEPGDDPSSAPNDDSPSDETDDPKSAENTTRVRSPWRGRGIRTPST